MIHQSHVRLLLFVVSRRETAKLCPKTNLHNLWIVSYFVLFSLSLRPMSIVSYQFCPVPTCAHHVFFTLCSCLSIDSSLYHVTVFSVFFVKGKLNLWPSVRILITYILINCEWFIIKLCGIGIILLTDLLYGITSHYFSIDLRFECIFKDWNALWKIFYISKVNCSILYMYIVVYFHWGYTCIKEEKDGTILIFFNSL